MTIVLAWIENGQRQAEVLTTNATTDDYAKAVAANAGLGRRIYTYQNDEPDPVARARRDLIQDQAWSSANLRRYHPVAV